MEGEGRRHRLLPAELMDPERFLRARRGSTLLFAGDSLAGHVYAFLGCWLLTGLELQQHGGVSASEADASAAASLAWTRRWDATMERHGQRLLAGVTASGASNRTMKAERASARAP